MCSRHYTSSISKHLGKVYTGIIVSTLEDPHPGYYTAKVYGEMERYEDGEYTMYININELPKRKKYYYRAFAISSIEKENPIYNVIYSFAKYGEVKAIEASQISCPDDNHPHAIDLGLPSGTKWCCMNVGASSPEQYGGYYAWGETNEKGVYEWNTYQYGSSRDNCQDIGSDIAGTSYDVAHVRMGGSWRMPSQEQQMELINNCTRTWTQQNGVNGILVTGKNGGQLFLPATGSRASRLRKAGFTGHYWSSSLHPHPGFAHDLYFDSDFLEWNGHFRRIGLSVRAVCP